MRNTVIMLLLIFVKRSFGQNDIPGFEFGHELEYVFYYEFIDSSCPFVNLTQKKYFSKRKDLKINSIAVKHIGRSLDSLFLADKKSFSFWVNSGAYDHGYSYIERYYYNKNGYMTSKTKYPLSSYLQKSDTGIADQHKIVSVNSKDSLIVCWYYKDSVWARSAYQANPVYTIEKVAINTPVYDSTTNMHSSNISGYMFAPTYYSFNSHGKIESITYNQKPYNFFKMRFQYPYKKNIDISCSMITFEGDSLTEMENNILKNSLGQIVKSTFHYKNNSDDYSSFRFHYDKHHNLYKITRRIKAKDWFDYTETLYQFNHFYKKGKLIKSIEHKNFKVHYNDVNYFYNESGLVSEAHLGNYKIYYEYTTYKN